VDRDGGMTEIGHYLPHLGNSHSVNWITGRILYAIDAERGIDVLRFAG
jgi:hypothetical protein